MIWKVHYPFYLVRRSAVVGLKDTPYDEYGKTAILCLFVYTHRLRGLTRGFSNVTGNLWLILK